MNLQVSGHHLEITPALRDYVTASSSGSPAISTT
jgi:ribosome-associated translation inhibitor RaiA